MTETCDSIVSAIQNSFWKHPTEQNLKTIQSSYERSIDSGKTNKSGDVAQEVFLAMVHELYDLGDENQAHFYAANHENVISDATFRLEVSELIDVHLDILWALFMASGDTAYSDRVYNVAVRPNTGDVLDFAVKNAAQWSYNSFYKDNKDIMKPLPRIDNNNSTSDPGCTIS